MSGTAEFQGIMDHGEKVGHQTGTLGANEFPAKLEP